MAPTKRCAGGLLVGSHFLLPSTPNCAKSDGFELGCLPRSCGAVGVGLEPAGSYAEAGWRDKLLHFWPMRTSRSLGLLGRGRNLGTEIDNAWGIVDCDVG